MDAPTMEKTTLSSELKITRNYVESISSILFGGSKGELKEGKENLIESLLDDIKSINHSLAEIEKALSAMR